MYTVDNVDFQMTCEHFHFLCECENCRKSVDSMFDLAFTPPTKRRVSPEPEAERAVELPQEFEPGPMLRLWTFTTLPGEAEPILTCELILKEFLKSSICKVKLMLACIERGADNNNWHIHALVLHTAYPDLSKIKNLKFLKNRRFEAKKLGKFGPCVLKDVEETTKYILKGEGKHPEVDAILGSSIFRFSK